MIVQNAEVEKEKTDVWKKTVNIIFTVFIVIVIFSFVINPIFIFCYFLFEKPITKLRINNEYVNLDYEGWKTVELEHFDNVTIPGEWNLTEKDFKVTLTDSDGIILAIGNIADYTDRGAFFEGHTGERLDEYQYLLYVRFKDMEFGTYAPLIYARRQFYAMSLEANEYKISPDDIWGPELFLIFEEDCPYEYEELCEICEAICFYQHYGP